MPRRKATRTVPKAPKPRLEIPGLALTQEMSKQEKQEQLEIFLGGYKYKVKETIKALEREQASLTTWIKQHWDLQLQKIPSSLWDMTLSDFVDAGGTVESVLKQKESSYKAIDSRIGLISNREIPIIEEESSGETQDQTTDVKPNARAKKTTAFCAPQTTVGRPVRRSARASKLKFATPANSQAKCVWGATPMVTPKFDPRLPATPENIREMKPGERLMSIAGSPVHLGDGRRKGAVGTTSNANVHEVTDEIYKMYGLTLCPEGLERILRVKGVL